MEKLKLKTNVSALPEVEYLFVIRDQQVLPIPDDIECGGCNKGNDGVFMYYDKDAVEFRDGTYYRKPRLLYRCKQCKTEITTSEMEAIDLDNYIITNAKGNPL